MAATELLPRDPGISRVLDTRGLLCPYPFIRSKQLLEVLPSGSTVEIVTDSEPTATSSIPVLCERNGYEYKSEREDGIWRLLVTKP